MFFRQILHEGKSCASYLIGCPTFGPCAVVDPQGEPRAYLDRIQDAGLQQITAVFDTHIHADHVSSARELAELTGAPLYYGPGAEVNFKHESLSDGQQLHIGNRRIHVLHTPGHTPEHVCLVVDDWFVITGDTLFVGDVGRVDLALQNPPPGVLKQRAEQLYRSIQRLLELEDFVEVYPGHYSGSVCGRGMDGKPVSTVGREKRKNQPLFLSAAEFARFQTENVPPLPEDFHAIKRKNLGLA